MLSRRRLRRDAAVAPSASDAAVGARLAANRVRSLNLGMPRRRDAHAVVASRIWAASVDAEAAEVARARREALEQSVRDEKPAAPKIDWAALENAASARGDLLAGCAICLGPFSGFEDGSTMLLDCAHAFHASCLAALERHLGVENRRCALCRKTGYAKHVTKRAARDRRAAAARAITCAARAHLAVKRTDKARRAFYGAGRGEALAARANERIAALALPLWVSAIVVPPELSDQPPRALINGVVLAPGDPVDLFLGGAAGGQGLSTDRGADIEEARRQLRRQLGLDRPLYQQYLGWLGKLALQIEPLDAYERQARLARC